MSSWLPPGPKADHTTGNGYFLYIDSSKPRQLFDKARLVHPNVFPSGQGVCTLRFYYNMYGSRNMGYLSVYLVYSGYSQWTQVWRTRGMNKKKTQSKIVSTSHEHAFPTEKWIILLPVVIISQNNRVFLF